MYLSILSHDDSILTLEQIILNYWCVHCFAQQGFYFGVTLVTPTG